MRITFNYSSDDKEDDLPFQNNTTKNCNISSKSTKIESTPYKFFIKQSLDVKKNNKHKGVSKRKQNLIGKKSPKIQKNRLDLSKRITISGEQSLNYKQIKSKNNENINKVCENTEAEQIPKARKRSFNEIERRANYIKNNKYLKSSLSTSNYKFFKSRNNFDKYLTGSNKNITNLPKEKNSFVPFEGKYFQIRNLKTNFDFSQSNDIFDELKEDVKVKVLSSGKENISAYNKLKKGLFESKINIPFSLDSTDEKIYKSFSKSDNFYSNLTNTLVNKEKSHKSNSEKITAADILSLTSSKIKSLNNKNIMSMYDRRLQAEERPLNGYANTRGLHSNDELSIGSMNSHYYHCSPSPPQPTMATLCNIGNTCYLNSVIYTLRFAPMFIHNLHHLVDDLSKIQQSIGKHHLKSSSLGRNVTGLHTENSRSWSSKDLASLENISCDIPKSNQQIATEKLHELYQNLHRNEYTDSVEPFHADTFLHAIQDVSSIFEGNQQQDAHEFLMCVLDNIRETCQKLIKSISDCPDMITNGYISLPEQKELKCATINKEKPLQRDAGSSAIIKTSFFSRKSKRKDAEAKFSKNNVTNSINNSLTSPHKNNNHEIPPSSNGSISVKDPLSSSKYNDKIELPLPESDLTGIKDIKVMTEKIKKLGFDFFTEDFEGITVSTTKCLSCETVTEQKQTMIDIAVPITRYENVDLSEKTEKAEKFIQDSCVTKEYFRGENKYRCEQCMGYTEAIRSISYEVLPRLLIIQLSRFSGVMEKINTYLPTPLTLQCFCSKCFSYTSSSSSSSSSSSAMQEHKNLHVYKLYSVITHVGATMSVGHYIAYTCSLDWANDYLNCPKDRVRQAQIIKQQQTSSATNIGNNINNVCNGAEKNVKSMKKIIFGRSKTSSNGDMGKTIKNINGLSNKSISANNSVEKFNNINTTCPSINCCGLQLRKKYLMNSNSTSGSSILNSSSGYSIDVDDNHQTILSSTSGYNSNNYNNSNSMSNESGLSGSSCSGNISQNNQKNNIRNEPVWYMCDDDKIKAMSQREFEDMLSPNGKNITPYLLFYARNDIAV